MNPRAVPLPADATAPARAVDAGGRITEGDLETVHASAFGWAMACCDRRREEAEDVLQTTYEKVLDGRARFDGRSELRTWLFGVIRRTAAERRRSRVLRGRALARLVAARTRPAPVDGPERTALAAGEVDRLTRALACLSRSQREILHLVFYQDLTVAEAASVLGVRPGTASTHYARAKARLRALLEEGSP